MKGLGRRVGPRPKHRLLAATMATMNVLILIIPIILHKCFTVVSGTIDIIITYHCRLHLFW